VEQDAELAERLPAFHLEGPYLCPDDGPRGAHPREHIRDPDPDEFQRLQDLAGGRIRLVTLAPERPGAIPLIEQLTATGVVVSIGHTAATAAQIADAVRAGARLSTHLGNGCHATLPRHDNYLWEQMANDSLTASVIADGHHLPPPVLKSIIRAKTPRRVILTCDAGTFAGSPPGRYSDWGTELEVQPGGKIVLPGTPFLAGSGVFTDTCVSGAIRHGGVSLSEAIQMASVRPRGLLGLPVPAITPGSRGPFVLFDWQPGGEVTVRRVV
jgi:N-acetylglucosamine-6-phosphate deacetylase